MLSFSKKFQHAFHVLLSYMVTGEEMPVCLEALGSGIWACCIAAGSLFELFKDSPF